MRTLLAAALMAFAATTAPRLAKVPVPQWKCDVSPVTRCTLRGLTPNCSRNNLGERGEVSLPLGTDAGGHTDAAVSLHRHPCPFVRADAGGLDEGHQTNTHMFSFRPQTRLLFFDKFLVPDQLERLI